jgi:hypothetical protein
MLEAERRDARARGDKRMYLSYDKSHARWYVRVERKGRKIGLREVYGTAEFDAAYRAAVAELGGEVRLRRVDPDPKANDMRRYLLADRSRHGQLRHYVQIRDGIPKIRIRAEHGTEEFDRLVTRAVESQIALYGDVTHTVGETKRVRLTLPLPVTPPAPGTLRWYWTDYKQSGHWLGNESLGLKGLGSNSRHQRVLLMEPILYANGEKPFAVLSRKAIRAELEARTPTQAGNLLSAIRGLVRWMIDEGHVEPEDDPTIGLRTGKTAVSRESGGFKVWGEADMDAFRARWEIGSEARLMFEILRCTHFRLGDAARFGPQHVGKGRVTLTTEKSGFKTPVTLPLHCDLAEAINATPTGADVFVGKVHKGAIVPMTKEAWGAKFKAYAVLAGVNEPLKNCHGVRKARAEDAAYADCTEAQMMAMFGWTDPKMPALYIAKANREKLGLSGMDKLMAQDRSENIDAIKRVASENGRVTFLSNKFGRR